MSKAIKINLTKAPEQYDYGASKLFGAPVVPESWADKFAEDIIFFGQLRLEDIAPYDPENRLPHTGYLYLFLDTEMYPYTAWAEHCQEEARLVIEDFNELDPEFAHLNQAFLMSFEEADECCEGTHLFGTPSSDCGEEGELLLQFDPLDTATGFLETIDGYAYFFFGEGRDRIDGVRFVIDWS